MDDSIRMLCCDWGTTNFRLHLLDNNKIAGGVESGKGNAVLFREWSAQKEISRLDYYRSFLQTQIDKLSTLLSMPLQAVPVILSGMSSSSIGMMEIPYSSLPFDLTQPALRFKKIKETTQYPNELHIFGGLSHNNDVIRGEETQVVGLNKLIHTSHFICILPGTHSKHVYVKENQIVDFRSYMTGEVFSLLQNHSILQSSLAKGSVMDAQDRQWFEKGVAMSSESNLLNAIFKTRTNVMLRNISRENNYFFLSGLLIGYELRDLLNSGYDIWICGSKKISELYKITLEILAGNRVAHIVPQDQMQWVIPKAHKLLYNGATINKKL